MKTLTRTFRTAGIALRRNVLRSLLTCLGIIIGVASVIAIVEIGNGSSVTIEKGIASMGANTLVVLPGTAASGGISFGQGSVMTLTPQDADAILAECPSVANVTPIVRARSTQVVYGNRNWIPQQVSGVTPEFLAIRDWADMADGESFTDRDVRNASKVCVVGQTLVRELFDGHSPVGKDIRIGSVTFRVVGALSGKGANMMGSDQDDIILAPWTTVKYRVSNEAFGGQAAATSGTAAAASSSTVDTSVNTLSGLYPQTTSSLYPDRSTQQAADYPLPVRFTNVDQILCASTGRAATQSAIAEITSLLRERHHLRGAEADDFQIRDMTELANTMTKTTNLVGNLLLVVAAISLAVGGVGIMNIMLVSVTERTREIGLRMAVGARGRDILRQFLIEAILLCLAGGAVGIVIGRLASIVVRHVAQWPTEVSMPAIAASVAVSATVGVLFGYYPAWKASRLDPIEALRYE